MKFLDTRVWRRVFLLVGWGRRGAGGVPHGGPCALLIQSGLATGPVVQKPFEEDVAICILLIKNQPNFYLSFTPNYLREYQ